MEAAVGRTNCCSLAFVHVKVKCSIHETLTLSPPRLLHPRLLAAKPCVFSTSVDAGTPRGLIEDCFGPSAVSSAAVQAQTCIFAAGRFTRGNREVTRLAASFADREPDCSNAGSSEISFTRSLLWY